MSVSTSATTVSESANRFQSAAELQAEIRATQAALPANKAEIEARKAEIEAKKAEIEAEIESLLQALRLKRTELQAKFGRWESENGLSDLGKWLTHLEALLFAHHRNIFFQWLTHSRVQHPIPEEWVKRFWYPEWPHQWQLQRYYHPSRRRTVELHIEQDKVNPAHFIFEFVLLLDRHDKAYGPITADEGTEVRVSLYPMLSCAWQTVCADGEWFQTKGNLLISDDGLQFPNPIPAAELTRQCSINIPSFGCPCRYQGTPPV
jgi:hypothetical protein